MKFYIHTFGCQMNVNESQKVAALLRGRGFQEAPSPEEATLILVNTCSVREKPEKKVFSFIGRVKTPGKTIGVMGCVAQQHGRELLSREPAVDFVVGTQALHRVPEIVSQVLRNRSRIAATPFMDPEDSLTIFREPLAEPGSSAFVSIMQGCDRFCAYCIVPFVRGRERSRPSKEILNEIQGLVAKGVTEVVLLGQNVNRYGMDRKQDLTFPGLLRKIDRISGIRRIRFVTSHPASLNDETIRLFRELKHLCETIHLPFQSGSDRILELMGRGYTREMYLDRIDRLREACPEIAISADVMVGFPGETEKDFSDTLSLIERVRFDTLFSFRFTPRPITRAAAYPRQVDEDEKLKRLQALQALQSRITLEKNREQEGKIKQILVEKPSRYPEQYMMGRARDNRIVHFEAPLSLKGREVKVRIVKGFQNSLLGKLEDGHVH